MMFTCGSSGCGGYEFAYGISIHKYSLKSPATVRRVSGNGNRQLLDRADVSCCSPTYPGPFLIVFGRTDPPDGII